MSASQTTDSAEAIQALMDRWTRVHEGELDLVEDCVQPTYIRHDSQGDRVATPAEQRAKIAARREAIPDVRTTIHASTIAPPLVWCRWTMTGTRDGQRVTLAGLQVYRVENGKLAETWTADRGLGSRWPDSPA